MALHDRDIKRTMACGIAGLSVAADSLSAIKYAKVRPVRDENNIAVDFEIEGDYRQFGNNDDRVDSIAYDLVERFMKKVASHKMYPLMPSRHNRYSPSPLTWSTAKKPATRPTAAAQAHRSAQVPTRCTAAM